jgi:hypothetical protein
LQNPKVYLQTHAVECYNIKAAALGTALTSVGESIDNDTCGTILEFDLVPQPGKYVSLVILGAVGSYKKTWRWGQPIVAAWMPYLGQIATPNVNKIGRINLTTVPAHVNYVFTAGLGGCNFVARQDGANTMLYHEPTAAEWTGNPAYGGAHLLKVGPAYNDDRNEIGGFGMAMRSPGGWKLLFQLLNGVNIVQVTEHDV